jgi:hypothetical protein
VIFPSAQAYAILERRKIEVRFPAKPDEDEPRIQVGGTYAVEAMVPPMDPYTKERAKIPGLPDRVRDTLGHMHVMGIREQLLHDVTDQEAQLEGHVDRMAFFDGFLDYFGEGWGHRAGEVDREVRIWVLTVEPTESPRWLAIGTRSPSDKRGYSHSKAGALEDEQEAVDPIWLEKFSEEAAAGDADRQAKRRAAWERLSLSERMAIVERARGRVDVSRRLRRIDRELAEAFKAIDQAGLDRAA